MRDVQLRSFGGDGSRMIFLGSRGGADWERGGSGVWDARWDLGRGRRSSLGWMRADLFTCGCFHTFIFSCRMHMFYSSLFLD
jgi:hypothetical protein